MLKNVDAYNIKISLKFTILNFVNFFNHFDIFTNCIDLLTYRFIDYSLL